MFALGRRSLLLLLGAVAYGHAGNKFSGQTCTTPSNQPGNCIPSEQCSPYTLALNVKEIKHVEYLRHLQCSSDPEVDKVCCPINGNYSFTPLQKPAQKRSRPLLPAKLPSIGDRFADDELLPIGEDCGQQSADKVYAGEITKIDEFPWMALLKYKRKMKDGSPILACGGVLINHRYVLTAAHCVTGTDVTQTLQGLDAVRLGEYNILEEIDCVIENEWEDCADPIIDVGYEEIIPHPLYNISDLNQYNDIALIRMNKDVPYTDFIQPICLPIKGNDNIKLSPGTKLFVAGWGRTEFKDQPSPVKLKLALPLVDKSKCVDPYTKFGIRIQDTQLCAGGELGRDTCKGDSGGPLMCADKATGSWITSGIVSIGPNKCGVSQLPGIYTNVKDYIDWIVENVKP